MTYTIIETVPAFKEDANDLIRKVNALMDKGWKPLGGCSTNTIVIDYIVTVKYSQAMILGD